MKIVSLKVADKEFYNILKQVNKVISLLSLKGQEMKIMQSLSARVNGAAYKKL